MRQSIRHLLYKWLKILLLSLFTYIAIVYAVILFSPDIAMRVEDLPPSIRDNQHNDYALPGSTFIPRTWTSMHFVEPPILILGANNIRSAQALNGSRGPKPVPDKGQWEIVVVQVKQRWPLYLPYVAWTSSGGIHMRAGCRWDDVDHYYTFPSMAFKLIR